MFMNFALVGALPGTQLVPSLASRRNRSTSRNQTGNEGTIFAAHSRSMQCFITFTDLFHCFSGFKLLSSQVASATSYNAQGDVENALSHSCALHTLRSASFIIQTAYEMPGISGEHLTFLAAEHQRDFFQEFCRAPSARRYDMLLEFAEYVLKCFFYFGCFSNVMF